MKKEGFYAKVVILHCILILWGCSENNHDNRNSQDWHPAINNQLINLDHQKILTFGKTEKEDGQYCYVRYEGYLRQEKELIQTQQLLAEIVKKIDEILKSDFALTTTEITKNKNIPRIELLEDSDLRYLQKKI